VGIGASLILIAAGAILWWAVDVDTKGFDLNTVGVILFVVGWIGLAISMIFWSSWGGLGGWRRERYVERDVAYPDDVPPRASYRERERTY
jgi:hypothetical protein